MIGLLVAGLFLMGLLVMAVLFVVGIAVLVSSIIGDLAYSVADPRIRFVRGN